MGDVGAGKAVSVIRLSSSELITAATIGALRQITNLRDGRTAAYGSVEESPWQIHIEGACAEMAVAKAMNRFWSGALGALDADDVGPLQVRSTARRDGSLILHAEDRDDRAFVLVTGQAPTYVLRGWIHAAHGKRKEFYRSDVRHPAYFVPQNALKPMEQLIHDNHVA